VFVRWHILQLPVALAGSYPATAQPVPRGELPLQVEAEIAVGEVRGRQSFLAFHEPPAHAVLDLKDSSVLCPMPRAP
jgi:hypothetical protein